jgi:hypothetical protein
VVKKRSAVSSQIVHAKISWLRHRDPHTDPMHRISTKSVTIYSQFYRYFGIVQNQTSNSMKKNLLPFCVLPFLLFAFAVNAQHKHLYKSFFIKDLKKSPPAISGPMSYKTGTPRWHRISTYTVSPDNADTFGFSKYTYLLNDSLSQVLAREHQSDKTFTDKYLVTYFYDPSGRRNVTLNQFYDTLHYLRNGDKDSSNYDSHGNLTYQVREMWNAGSWEIQYGNKSNFTYDSKGNIVQIIAQFTDTTGTFQDDNKQVFYWNTAGTIIDSGFFYSLDSLKNWRLEAKVKNLILYKNNINKPVSGLIQIDTAGKWEDAERLTASYNILGYPLTSLYEEYRNGAWVPLERLRSKYNSHNDRYYSINEFYVDSIKSFMGFDGTADSLIYDANGNLTSDQVFYMLWDTTWQTGNKQLHQYKDVSGIEIVNDSRGGYTIFPNPCNDQFFINNINPSESLKVSIYDVSGRVLLENHYTGEAQITVNTDLLPKGIYNIVINNGKRASSIRLVKN